MAEIKMPHPDHDKHLCYLNNLDYQRNHPTEYKALIRHPKFYCENCGRAAAGRKNLCKPADL
jgi:hypothetical protein